MLKRFSTFWPTRWLAMLTCAAACSGVQAQLLTDNDPTWQEGDVPPIPAFSTDNLIALAGPVTSSLTFGVDPNTFSIGADDVVRYVVVIQGPSARTVLYEGIRCRTGEKRVYARRNGDSDWDTVKEDWRPLRQSSASQYALNLAQEGACVGPARASSVRDIVNALRNPNNHLN